MDSKIKNARRQLEYWRLMGDKFEKAYCFFDRKEMVINLFVKKLQMNENTPQAIRKLIARKIKYWKTICRYPTEKNQTILITLDRFNVRYDELEKFNLKFPLKVRVSGDWDSFPHNTPMVQISEKHWVSITYFLTSSPAHNAQIKKFNLYLNGEQK